MSHFRRTIMSHSECDPSWASPPEPSTARIQPIPCTLAPPLHGGGVLDWIGDSRAVTTLSGAGPQPVRRRGEAGHQPTYPPPLDPEWRVGPGRRSRPAALQAT